MMSVDTFVYLRKDRFPSVADWAKAIADQGFSLEMDTEFDPLDFCGYLPCRYKGEDCGFEYASEDGALAEFVEEGLLSDEEASELGDSDFLVTFTTHSNFRDLAVAGIAAAVLAELSDGFIAEDGEPPFIPGSEAVQQMKTRLPGLESEFDSPD